MKYQNMPVCDLRNITSAEQARAIEAIENVALLLMPASPDDDLKAALAAIPRKNIAGTANIDENARVSVVNGCTEISDPPAGDDGQAHFLVNGLAAVSSLPEGVTLNLYLNGLAVISSSLKSSGRVALPLLNGSAEYMDFDRCKVFSDSFFMDADTLRYIDSGTLIVSGGDIELDAGITPEMLEERRVSLFAGDDIICPPHLAGYARAKFLSGGQIVVKNGRQG